MSDMKTQRILLEARKDAFTVERNLSYPSASGDHLQLDLYRPAAAADRPAPAVVLVTGYPGVGFAAVMGCSFRQHGAYVSWAELLAAAGMVAINYDQRDPAPDALKLLEYLRDDAAALRIDPARIAIWSCSGNVPVALSLLAQNRPPRCAALCYGFLMDLENATEVAAAAAEFRFANPMAGGRIDELKPVPMLLVRAGQDETPGLNACIDRFVPAALAANLPLTLVNHPTGRHAFDLVDDDETSRQTITGIVDYLRARLV